MMCTSACMMTLVGLDKQLPDWKSPHDWPVQPGDYLAVFSLRRSETSPLVAIHQLPPHTPIRSLVVLSTVIEYYLKWWAIQLAVFLQSSSTETT